MSNADKFLPKFKFLTAGFQDFRADSQKSMATVVTFGARRENALPRSDEMTTITAVSLVTQLLGSHAKSQIPDRLLHNLNLHAYS